MFSPTFQDWPRLNRLMLFALLAVLGTALLVLYLYVMPKWRQHQDYQQAIREKENRLAATPWPQDTELLRHQYRLIREKLDGVPGTDQIGLAKLSEDIIQQATSTFSERILSQFDSARHFINGVSRLDYKDSYDRFAQELAEQQLTIESTRFGLNEDGQDPVWQMILKLWTAQTLCQLYLQLVDNRIRIESNFVKLLCYLTNIMGMRVTNADNGMSTIKVEILLTFVVPHFTTFSLDDVYIEEWINVE